MASTFLLWFWVGLGAGKAPVGMMGLFWTWDYL